MTNIHNSTEGSPLDLPAFSNRSVDIYFSADIETDGQIPGPNSMLSFALTYAGAFDGERFYRPNSYSISFYRELRPISNDYDSEALAVNGLDRQRLVGAGTDPFEAMTEAAQWVKRIAGQYDPICVAYPLSFDWSWLYWYFVRFSHEGSPFGFSRCFDLKTAVAVKLGRTISGSGRDRIPHRLKSYRNHTHNALDDAIEQAEIFANIFEVKGQNEQVS